MKRFEFIFYHTKTMHGYSYCGDIECPSSISITFIFVPKVLHGWFEQSQTDFHTLNATNNKLR